MDFVNHTGRFRGGRTPLQRQHVRAHDALPSVLERDVRRRRVAFERLAQTPNDESGPPDRRTGRYRGVESGPMDATGPTEPNVHQR